MMQKPNKSTLHRSSLYRWFRYSSLYSWYARVFHRSFAVMVASDRSFFKALFTESRIQVVYDVGANVGDKSEVFRRLCRQVICVEADPETAGTLNYRFRNLSNVLIEPVAVGERVGQAELRLKHHSGFNTLSEKWASAMEAQSLPTNDVVTVPITTLDDLIKKHGQPDYIKIDVEGYEFPVVLGLTSIVPVISFECNVPLFRSETDQVIERLLSLSPITRFNGRLSDSPTWMLPGLADVNGLRRMLDAAGNTTLDIFAFSRGSY